MIMYLREQIISASDKIEVCLSLDELLEVEYISRCVKVELVPSNGRKLDQMGTLNRLNLE